jgi:hypothetical protein
MEAEGIALLQDDARKLAPDFDDERFVMVSLLDHGADLPCPRSTWSRSDERAMVEACRIRPAHEQITSVRHQYGGRNFFALASRINMTNE